MMRLKRSKQTNTMILIHEQRRILDLNILHFELAGAHLDECFQKTTCPDQSA